MRYSKLAFLSLLAIPTLATAQRGGGGGGGGSSKERGSKEADWNSVLNANKQGIKLSRGDLEDMSPLKLLVDKRKDLKLSDDQLKKLKDTESSLRDQLQESYKAFDSLRRASQPPLHDPTDDDRERMSSARRTAMSVVNVVREKYAAAAKDAVATLDENQQKTATELLDKHKKDVEETLREKLGGGGRG